MNLELIGKILLLWACLACSTCNADDLDVTLLGSFGLYSSWTSKTDSTTFDIQHKTGIAIKFSSRNQASIAWEFYYAKNQAELTLTDQDLLSFNLETVQFGVSKTINPGHLSEYVGGGIGVTRYSPRNFSGREKDDLSFSFFSGVNAQLADNLLATFEGRLQWSVLDSATHIACNGGCIVEIKSQLWGQLQLQAGITYRF